LRWRRAGKRAARIDEGGEVERECGRAVPGSGTGTDSAGGRSRDDPGDGPGLKEKPEMLQVLQSALRMPAEDRTDGR
jgi:hypothetical protein